MISTAPKFKYTMILFSESRRGSPDSDSGGLRRDSDAARPGGGAGPGSTSALSRVNVGGTTVPQGDRLRVTG